MRSKNTKEPKSSELTYRKGFESSDSMIIALDSVVWLIKSRYMERKIDSGPDAFGFIIRKLNVQFSVEVTEEALQADYANGAFTILAPENPEETHTQREARRRELLLFYGPLIPEAQIRATVQIHSLLLKRAQDDLVQQFLRHRAKVQE